MKSTIRYRDVRDLTFIGAIYNSAIYGGDRRHRYPGFSLEARGQQAK
jgi:hypothetical protein